MENQAIEPKILMISGGLAVDNARAGKRRFGVVMGVLGRIAGPGLSFGEYNGK